MAVFRRRDGRSAPTGPQRSGGRRQPSFLAREECAPAQGKKVGGAVAGTRPAGARPAAKRERLGGSGHSLPRENDAGSVTPPAENACRQIQPATTSKGAIQPKHDTSGSPVRAPLGRGVKRGPARPVGYETPFTGYRAGLSKRLPSTALCSPEERRSANLAP